MLQDVLRQADAILNTQTVPEEKPVRNLFEQCSSIIDVALSEKHPINASKAAVEEGSATSSLLDLDNGNKRKTPTTRSKPTNNKNSFRQTATKSISSFLHDIIHHPKVFFDSDLLTHYTEIQCRLKNVDHIPEVFHLYATKPEPVAGGLETSYNETKPNGIMNAIPKALADKALQVALEQKNMPLALAIADTSYCKPAFRKNKILRKAGFPILGLVLAPRAAYLIAEYLATFQSTMAHSTATWMTFSAIMAYMGVTASMGLVAIATANDQMERVSWLGGTALSQRWVREDEREAMDKIAQAWGFKDKAMRGEEEGEDWENLRELLGMRGMVLDKTELMEGME